MRGTFLLLDVNPNTFLVDSGGCGFRGNVSVWNQRMREKKRIIHKCLACRQRNKEWLLWMAKWANTCSLISNLTRLQLSVICRKNGQIFVTTNEKADSCQRWHYLCLWQSWCAVEFQRFLYLKGQTERRFWRRGDN